MDRKLKDVDREDEIRQAFKVFDKDGNGYITSDELGIVMTSLGERLSANELKQMMTEADTNGDGKIDYAEFVKVHLSLPFPVPGNRPALTFCLDDAEQVTNPSVHTRACA